MCDWAVLLIYCLLICRKLIDETLKAFGKIDILVNNASMQEDLLDSFTGRGLSAR